MSVVRELFLRGFFQKLHELYTTNRVASSFSSVLPILIFCWYFLSPMFFVINRTSSFLIILHYTCYINSWIQTLIHLTQEFIGLYSDHGWSSGSKGCESWSNGSNLEIDSTSNKFLGDFEHSIHQIIRLPKATTVNLA